MTLLVTPSGVFVRLAPFLVALASLAMLVQPWLTARTPRESGRLRLLTWPLIGLVSIYSGYFGAGSGIMLLAVLLVLVDNRVPEANAIKNMLLGAATLASAVVFVVAGPVDWTAVVPLAAGLFAGSAAGPVIARRVSPRALRWTSPASVSGSRSRCGGVRAEPRSHDGGPRRFPVSLRRTGWCRIQVGEGPGQLGWTGENQAAPPDRLRVARPRQVMSTRQPESVWARTSSTCPRPLVRSSGCGLCRMSQ